MPSLVDPLQEDKTIIIDLLLLSFARQPTKTFPMSVLDGSDSLSIVMCVSTLVVLTDSLGGL